MRARRNSQVGRGDDANMAKVGDEATCGKQVDDADVAVSEKGMSGVFEVNCWPWKLSV